MGPFDGLTIVLGILCIVGFAWSQLRKRARVAKVGLVPEPMSLTVLKIVLVAVVIAFVTYLLASSGNADQGGTPIMLVIVGVLVFIYNFILTKTVFGRHVYAVGGNRKAAILSGINTRRVDFLLFVHMGFLSAVAAVCMLSRLASATAQAGMEFEMDAIAACFIGGTAVTGGIGTIPGAVIGAFVMGVINQGLSIMGVDTAVVKTIKGSCSCWPSPWTSCPSARRADLPLSPPRCGIRAGAAGADPTLLSAVILVIKGLFPP